MCCRDIVSENEYQLSIFSTRKDFKKDGRLMSALDLINFRYGRNTISLASSGLKKVWIMKRQKSSPEYTTDWRELLVIKS